MWRRLRFKTGASQACMLLISCFLIYLLYFAVRKRSAQPRAPAALSPDMQFLEQKFLRVPPACRKLYSGQNWRTCTFKDLQDERRTQHAWRPRKVRMLFLTNWAYLQTFMDRWFFLRYDAASRHPFVEAHMWGLGFPGYQEGLTLRENLVTKFGSVYFDIVVVWIWSMHAQIRNISDDTAVMFMQDEMWCEPGKNCTAALDDESMNAKLMARAYPHEMLLPSNQIRTTKGLYFHLPKTVAAEIFYHPPEAERDIDVLLAGRMHPWVYGYRSKLLELLQSVQNGTAFPGKLPPKFKFMWLEHPGYWERSPPENASYEMAMQQLNSFAALMKRCKIFITDSSRYAYSVGKYAEIPTAGALVLADIPHDRDLFFKQFVIELTPNTTRLDALEIINYWLTHDKERIERARLGQVVTLTQFTNDHSIDLILEAYDRLMEGQRGSWWPYPYSVRCRAISPVHWSKECPRTDDDQNYYYASWPEDRAHRFD